MSPNRSGAGLQRLRWILASAIVLSLASWPASGELPNRHCPVQKEKLALSEYSTVYQGRRIHFCCEDCLAAFLATPEAFLADLDPPLATVKSSLGHDHPPGWQPPGLGTDATAGAAPTLSQHLAGRAWSALRWIEAHAGWGIGVVMVLGFVLVRSLRGRDWRGELRSQVRAEIGALRRPSVPLTLPLLLLATTLLVALVQERERRIETQAALEEIRLRQHIHFATFSDFGDPPVPTHPPLPPRLSGTFYRGNDERDPALFNGGHYRTATFQVSLRDAAGEQLRYGQGVAGQPLFLHLEIERGKNTPDYFWLPIRMKAMHLTKESGHFSGAKAPVRDRVGLSIVEPLQLWRAVYPLGPGPGGDSRSQGLVYLREQLSGGARFHYGVAYALHARGGLLATDSDVSMGALYRTRKVLPSRLPLHEWFSHLPIPTLPAPRSARPSVLRQDLDTGLDTAPR